MKTTIAVFDKKGRNAYPAVKKFLEQLRVENACFMMALPSTVLQTEDVRELRQESVSSPVVIGAVYPKMLAGEWAQVARTENAVSVFEGHLYSSTGKASGLLQKAQCANAKAMEELVKETEGDFFIITAEPERILAARDPIGVQPMYYGENVDYAAIASNRTALWELGIIDPCSFTPGNLAIVNREGFQFKPLRPLGYSNPVQTTLDEAAQALRELLEHSVKARLRNVKQASVAFSGGLDSSIIAFLAKKYCARVNLVHVSLRGQPETEDARKAAAELKLPLSVFLFDPEDVEKSVARVVGLIEEPDPVKVAVGIPFYWAAQKTAECGLDVLLAGQGADELFGGYQRYVNEYLCHGASGLQEIMYADIARLHKTNIERDKKICNFHDVDLRLPFASYTIAKFALSLPLKLKIENKPHGQRKIVLRKVALNLGLPEAIANKPKKAVQYATGVNAVLGKIAKKRNMTVRAYVERLFLEQKSRH